MHITLDTPSAPIEFMYASHFHVLVFRILFYIRSVVANFDIRTFSDRL